MATDNNRVEINLEDAVNAFESATFKFKEDFTYYNADKRDLAIGLTTPPALRPLLAQVGVPRLYINAIADRLNIEGFRIGDSSETDEDLWAWYKANSLETSGRLAFVDAMVYGRSYITISMPTDADKENPLMIQDVPVIRLESPLNLYAEVDPRTRDVLWAVRVIKDKSGDTIGATLYTAEATEIYEKGETGLALVDSIQHGLGVVPVVPMIRASSVQDIYGTSMITPEIRSITDAMSRTMMNMQTTSELMANPQRAIFGSSIEELTGSDDGPKTGLELYTSSYLIMESPEGKIDQLPAAELRNYTEALTFQMKVAAAYTGLPPQYLSFSNDNPASAEAIRSSETRLVQTCESLTSMFGDAWERAMRIALLVMGTQLTIDHFRMETVWRDPGTPTYQAMADATQKLYNSGNGVITLEQARIDMGYTPEQRRQMEEQDRKNPNSLAMAMYGGEVTIPTEEGADESESAGNADG